MSVFPQPGELETMATFVPTPWLDRCIILTYGESQDVDGAPLVVYSEGDEIPCVWEPSTKAATEQAKAEYTISTSEWKLTIAADVIVTRRDMVKLTARFGNVLLEPVIGAVFGDPVPDIGCQEITVREVSQ
jgi:hypothetical protein